MEFRRRSRKYWVTECLAAQLQEDGSRLKASVFYPSGGLLRTGLWTSERTRPAELARERPRETEAMTPERLEEMASEAGRTLHWQPLDELAATVVDGIRDGRFVIMRDADVSDSAATLHARAEAFGSCRLPSPAHFG